MNLVRPEKFSLVSALTCTSSNPGSPQSLGPIHPKLAKLLSPFGRECRAFARLCDLILTGPREPDAMAA